MWPASILYPHISRLLIIVALWSAILHPRELFAQTGDQELFQLEKVDASQFPLVHLQLRARPTTGNVSLTSDSADSFNIEENGKSLTIVEYSTEESGLQVGLLIDPVMLAETAYSGQTYAADITYALYDMVGNEIFKRHEDQLAAFTMLPDGNQQTIQTWTLEPNLIYNSVAQRPPTALDADLLPTDAWLNVLNHFEPGVAGATQATTANASTPGGAAISPAKVLVVFLVGSQNIPPEFVAAAVVLDVQLHIVDMAGTDLALDRASSLLTLTQETAGTYLPFRSLTDLTTLYKHLETVRTVHQLAYVSELTEVGPVSISAALSDGTTSQISTALSAQAATEELGTSQGATSQTALATLENSPVDSNAVDNPAPTAVPLEEPVTQASSAQDPVAASETINPQSTALPQEEPPAERSTTELSGSEQTQAVQADLTPTNSAAEGQTAADSSVAVSTASEQNVAAQAQAPDASVSTATERSPQDSANVVISNMITIPFLNIDIPRLALQIALPLLLLLIGYVFYTERKQIRKGKEQAVVSGTPPVDPAWTTQRAPGAHNSPSIPVTDPYENFQPSTGQEAHGVMPSSPSEQSMQAAQVPVQPPAQPFQPPVVEPTASPALSNMGRTDSIYAQQSQEDEDTTSMLPNTSDDELTYRLTDEVETPVIGHLMRVTSDPNLPQMLAIHKLSSAVGTQHKLYIGRHSKKNTIVINDKRISREHAVIVQKDGQLYLRDNGSTSGTFLNWKQLRAGDELILRHSDLVSLGDVVYEFRMQGEDEATIATG